MKNILIVGGSSSIGKCIAKKFISTNTHVISTYNTSQNLCYNAEEQHFLLHLNIREHESIRNFIEKIKNGDGKDCYRFDAVFFLHGIIIGKNIFDYTYEEMELSMDVNFLGHAKLVKRLIPYMKNNSQFIFMSSISGEQGSYDPIYAAGKAALIGFAKSLAKTLSPNIRSNIIAPGSIDNSSMMNSMTKEVRDSHISQTPTKDFLQIDDLAQVIYDLTQSQWKHLNGATIDLNGGRYVR